MKTEPLNTALKEFERRIQTIYRTRFERALTGKLVNNYQRDEDGNLEIQCPPCESWFRLSEIKTEMEEVTLKDGTSCLWCNDCAEKR
jgi:hypothetical protein